MTLTEFLLARIAEDEVWARAAVETPGSEAWHWVHCDDDTVAIPDPFVAEYLTEDGGVSLRSVAELKPVSWGSGAPLPDFAIHSVDEVKSTVAGHITRHDPARVLAECEAKRTALAFAELVDEDVRRLAPDPFKTVVLDKIAAILALPYADHPDYQQEWKP